MGLMGSKQNDQLGLGLNQVGCNTDTIASSDASRLKVVGGSSPLISVSLFLTPGLLLRRPPANQSTTLAAAVSKALILGGLHDSNKAATSGIPAIPFPWFCSTMARLR